MNENQDRKAKQHFEYVQHNPQHLHNVEHVLAFQQMLARTLFQIRHLLSGKLQHPKHGVEALRSSMHHIHPRISQPIQNYHWSHIVIQRLVLMLQQAKLTNYREQANRQIGFLLAM